jgi:hypothetical protein
VGGLRKTVGGVGGRGCLVLAMMKIRYDYVERAAISQEVNDCFYHCMEVCHEERTER